MLYFCMPSKKICSKCKKNKSVCEFSFRDKGQGTRRADCKSCQKKVVKKHYGNNKDKYLSNNQKRRQKNRELLREYKKGPCTDCNRTFHPCQMDFDHINDNKVANVSKLMNSNYAKQAIEELKKCELVCSNCHRLRTWKRLND